MIVDTHPIKFIHQGENGMFKETQELIKKFELEQHANVEPVLEPAYWTVTVWMPLKGSPTPEKSKLRAGLWAKRYITTPESKGWVIVVRNPISENTFSIEHWDEMKLFDDFIKKVLDASLLAKDEVPEECGSSCG